jgi:hypothetical protein
MMRFSLLAGALALAAPAHAEPASQPNMKPDATPIPIESVTPQPKSMTIEEKIGMDWPRYDLGSKGHLSKPELDKWLTDLRASAGDTAPDDKWLGTAFTQTDTNKDKRVSKEELTVFLSSGR